jgi:hypothetical protein
MPDGSDRPVRISTLTKRSPLDLALLTTLTLHHLQPVPIPQRPAHLLRLSANRIAEIRRSGSEEDRFTIGEYTQWQLEYSTAVCENAKRLYGALWALRELANHPADPRVTEPIGRLVLMLGRDWGVHTIPETRQECDQLARETAQSMARVETRRWEDRG